MGQLRGVRAGLGALGFVLCAAGSASADTCILDPGATTELCLDWSQATDPVQGVDFFAFYGSSGAPSIYLVTGDLDWQIENKFVATGDPADIAFIGIRPATVNEDFAISIGTAGFSGTPGARRVGAIDLTRPSWIAPAPWQGWSRINGGNISADLSSALKLQSDAAAMGGDIVGDLRIGGNLTGTVRLLKVDSCNVDVEGKCAASMSMSKLESAVFSIYGHFAGKWEVEKEVRDSSISIGGDFTRYAKLNLNELSGYSNVRINDGGEPGIKSYAGTLNLFRGIPDGVIVTVLGHREPGSLIDMHGEDVAGWLDGAGGGYGDIRGGVIRSTGHVWAAAWPTIVFRGTCTFTGMDKFSVLETETSQNDGLFHVTGDMNGQMWARAAELLDSGVYQVDGDVGRDGSILTSGWSVQNRDGDLRGTVVIGGDVNGWMSFDGKMTANAKIDIGGKLDGPLTMGQDTEDGSTIHADGLGRGGSIQIATSSPQTAIPYRAHGNIVVGDPISMLLQPVEYDGCIRVFGTAFGAGGDLEGDIEVNGCHATTDDLNICIDGAIVGSITINQAGCPNQVTWSCSGCP